MSKQSSRRRSVLQGILSALSGKASQQNSQFTTQPKDPITDDGNMWYDYWQAHGEPWRTEPEIDTKRQKNLAQLRATMPDIEHGIYPFRDIKLSRADIEWLLSTHEDGPVNWADGHQRQREGLDLRGADLRNIDLSYLPLVCMRGGLDWEEWRDSTNEQRLASILHLNGADLTGAHLEGANLSRANLKQTKIGYAHLENVNFQGAHLEETFLYSAFLQDAYIVEAHLEKATLTYAHLEGADLGYAILEGVDLYEACLEGAFLYRSNLVGVRLCRAHLEGCFLKEVRLEKADLTEAHLGKTDLTEAHLEGAILRGAKFNDEKHIGPRLADVHLDDVDLTAVKWSQVEVPGDEVEARQKVKGGKKKNKMLRLEEYEIAVRANRQLAVALQGQGLNEDAARFAYRAQVLQKAVYWFQMVQSGITRKQRIRALGVWLFSWFLFLLAGYGYKPARSFLAYLIVIVGFATSYYLLGLHDVGSHHLAWYEAIVVSMTAFHGRGFFADQFHPGDPQAFVAAFEAFVGLIIEVTFIATLTRRLFRQ